MTMKPTLSVRDLTIQYAARRGLVRAIRNVSFDVLPGEALALIGESGSGKTTLGLGIVQLLPSTASIAGGSITYRRYASSHNGNGNGRPGAVSARDLLWDSAHGPDSATAPRVVRDVEREIEVLGLKGNDLRQFRWSECAMVFQSALNALNPVLRISEQFADTARAHGYLTGPRQGAELRERSYKLLSLVRLDADRVWRSFPHELSGGMRQRVLIALSLLLLPQLLILDEPTTALDILTQRNIMDVLKELRQKLDFSLIFISHDLSLAAELADRVATVYAGKIVEIGDVYTIFKNPHHPYTIGLIKAVPTLATDRSELTSIPGSPPDLIDLPSGCKFHPRCPLAIDKCRQDEPELMEVGEGHRAACWRWQEARAALKAFQVEGEA
jgi:peptide/nickel transport system ATP-binding protein